MGRYRRVHTRLWGDQKFRELSAPNPNGQSLWLYLLTGPHTGVIPGLSHVGEAALAEGLGWPVKGFREAFHEVFAKGMAKADWVARVVFLPNAARYNPPESPNVVKAWRKAFDEIPECDLKRESFCHIKGFLEGLPEAFREAFGKGLPEAFREALPESVAVAVTEPPYSPPRGTEWVEALNRLTGRTFKPSDTCMKHIQARLRAGHTLADAETVIRDRMAKWADDAKTRDWIRPETLFGAKFDTYLALARKPSLKTAPVGLDLTGNYPAASRNGGKEARTPVEVAPASPKPLGLAEIGGTVAPPMAATS